MKCQREFERHPLQLYLKDQKANHARNLEFYWRDPPPAYMRWEFMTSGEKKLWTQHELCDPSVFTLCGDKCPPAPPLRRSSWERPTACLRPHPPGPAQPARARRRLPPARARAPCRWPVTVRRLLACPCIWRRDFRHAHPVLSPCHGVLSGCPPVPAVSAD